MAVLEVRNLAKRFGGLTAVEDLDFEVKHGEILGLIGPNGAGKTTVFNLITGFHRPTRGGIVFLGDNITGAKPHEIARLGLIRTFQLVNLILKQTAYENMRFAYHLQRRAGVFASIFRTKTARRDEKAIHENTLKLLKGMGLYDVMDQQSGSLPHGLRKVLGVGVALAAGPKLLLLDEPTAGLSPAEAETLIGQIRGIRDGGIDIMVVEHNMKVIMNICDRIIVLNFGHKIAEGTPKEDSENSDVISAYLGFRRNDDQSA